MYVQPEKRARIERREKSTYRRVRTERISKEEKSVIRRGNVRSPPLRNGPGHEGWLGFFFVCFRYKYAQLALKEGSRHEARLVDG